MAFYLALPQGATSLENIISMGLTRLQFLCLLRDSKDENDAFSKLGASGIVEESSCLIDGSAQDRLSHFVLRLCCSSNHRFTAFLIEQETKLFAYRLLYQSNRELKLSLGSLKRQSTRLISQMRPGTFSDFCKTLAKFATEALYCKTPHIEVPFNHLCELVQDQKVFVLGGQAQVKLPDDLKIALTDLFKTSLFFALKQQKDSHHIFNDDSRVNLISSYILKKYHQNTIKKGMICQTSQTQLQLSDLEEAVQHFPPCMQHLHKLLRREHRLNHFARIQYTLFLKDAGLNIDDAMSFWGKEYSKPATNNSPSSSNSSCCVEGRRTHSCTHNWNKDSKRYIYGLRHLYGLEGARRNYRGHGCSALQEQDYAGSTHQGGCPFKSFDKESIVDLLDCDDVKLVEEVLKNVDEGDALDACHLYFDFLTQKQLGESSPISKKSKSEELKFTKPVEYFFNFRTVWNGLAEQS